MKKIPKGRIPDPRVKDILVTRPTKDQLSLWIAYWHKRQRAISAFRWAVVGTALAILSYLAYSHGIVSLVATYPVYTSIIVTVGTGATVIEVLGRRARFAVLIPPDDPGQFDLPYLPPGYTLADKDSLVHFPPQDLPGTYPPNSQDPYGRRWALQWPPMAKGDQGPRVLQFKFACVIVRAKWKDAKECRAEAEIQLQHGVNGSLRSGELTGIGRLNWYSDRWDRMIKRREQNPNGSITSAVANLIADSPTVGLNEYLYNPEITLIRDRFVVLPLFYMRSDYSSVYLCGPSEGITAGESPDNEPVRFNLKVTVSGVDSKSLAFAVACRAKWGDLTVNPAD